LQELSVRKDDSSPGEHDIHALALDQRYRLGQMVRLKPVVRVQKGDHVAPLVECQHRTNASGRGAAVSSILGQRNMNV
jgi:hypothetical protein